MENSLQVPVSTSLETSEGGLMELNDDCLLHLFRYISLTDLSCIKDTCERFRQLADQSFKLYRPKRLTINDSSLIADIWNLKHFGKFITSLTLDGSYDYYASYEDIFELMAKFTNVNLKSICLDLQFHQCVAFESVVCLEDILENVEEIKLIGFYNDSQIELILGLCNNLREVHLGGEDMSVTTFWCALNPDIKCLTLSGLFNDDILEEICEQLKFLECLSIEDIQETSNKMRNLAKLNHLKYLSFEAFSENVGHILQDLAKRDLLEYLSLSYVDVNVTIAQTFSKFTQLKELKLCHMENQIQENMLEMLSKHLAHIEKLAFIDCYLITFGEVTTIIKKHLKLKELLLTGCNKIDFIDRENYLRLKKPRKLQIILDNSVYESTMKLIESDLFNYVKITASPSN